MGQRRLFQLGSRMERGQEGVVLREQADGLCRVRALRLRRGIFQLGSRVVRRQEGVVLRQQKERLPEVVVLEQLPEGRSCGTDIFHAAMAGLGCGSAKQSNSRSLRWPVLAQAMLSRSLEAAGV